MDSDTQPLLADVDYHIKHQDSRARHESQPQRFCARCSSELEANRELKTSFGIRHGSIFLAIVLCVIMFILAVSEMSTTWWFRSPSILHIFVAIWTDVTITVLAVLLYMGRRRNVSHKLGRTIVQIRVLCALGFSWIVFIFAMIALNHEACRWRSSGATCALFTIDHVLAWLLSITLFSTAWATYRRAINIHGTHMVPIPTPRPLVAAWRLSDISDEGAIKI
ncbi:hypothetical protein C8R43DRAFT_1053208 [Mycena crocata]|nr:hypothetical protein C8R43DRAFT_1053208 [Mycena crocata]